VIPDVLASATLRNSLETELVKITEGGFTFDDFPSGLLGVFDEAYMSATSESFSCLSHEGPFLKAIRAGQILRGLYKVIYPPLYPLIGMLAVRIICRINLLPGYHELELAKTVWNAIASNEIQSQSEEEQFITQARSYLQSAEKILDSIAQSDREEGWGIDVEQLTGVLAK
jgi:hypothetical protein